MRWRSPQGNAAKDERSGMVGKLLVAVSAFLTDEADCIELSDFAFREVERRENGVGRGKTRQELIAVEGWSVNLSLRVARNAEAATSISHSSHCAKNVIRVVAKAAKSSQFVGDQGRFCFPPFAANRYICLQNACSGKIWQIRSLGLQPWGREFDPPQVHQSFQLLGFLSRSFMT